MMYSSCALMKVAVSQAIPKSAIAEIMPALNTDWSGTDVTSGRPTYRITAPTTNITRTMVVVMSIVIVLALDDERRPQVGEQAEDHDQR